MHTHKTVLDDALHALKRKIVQSVAGSAAVMAAAGGILVVPEILSEKNVTSALATLSQPKDQIESVITLAADYSQRAKSQLVQMDPAAGAPVQPRIAVASNDSIKSPVAMLTSPSASVDELITPLEAPARATTPVATMPTPAPQASAPRVLPEARGRFRAFDPMPDMPQVSIEAPRGNEAARVETPRLPDPAPVSEPPKMQQAVTRAERNEPARFGVTSPEPSVPATVPVAAKAEPARETAKVEPTASSEPINPVSASATAAPAADPKPAVVAARPAAKVVIPAFRAPEPEVAAPVSTKPNPAPRAAVEPRAEPRVLASADPDALIGIVVPKAPAAPVPMAIPESTLALIASEAFTSPTATANPEDLAPLPNAKPPLVEEEIPTEIYKGPDALKPTLVMPPKQEIAKPEEKPKWKTPAETLELTAKQRAKAERCLASAVYFESRNEPVRGQIAVAQVVMNRVFSPYYPGDVCAVVYQNAHRHLSCQFTFACDGIPDRVTERGPWARAQRIAKQTLDGKVWRPEVAKATHYHADYVKPRWIRDMRTLAKHGRHIFYRPHNWGDGRMELGWVREHEMPMPRSRPVMLASAAADALASAAVPSATTPAAAKPKLAVVTAKPAPVPAGKPAKVAAAKRR